MNCWENRVKERLEIKKEFDSFLLKESDSNRLCLELATWVAENKSNPRLYPIILMGVRDFIETGDPVETSDEEFLALFMQNRIKAKLLGINFFPSDEVLIDKEGVGDLYSEIHLELSHKINYQKIDKIARVFVETGDYPAPEDELGRFLIKKRSAIKNIHAGLTPKVKIYPDDDLIGRRLGLPDDWLKLLDGPIEKIIKKSEEAMVSFARFYKENKSYPPPDHPLYQFWEIKRKGATCSEGGLIFPTDYTAARRNGLPDDWASEESFRKWFIEKKQNDAKSEMLMIEEVGIGKVIALGKYYQIYGKLPVLSDAYDRNLGKWLCKYREIVKLGKGSKRLLELAEERGVPNDWLDPKYFTFPHRYGEESIPNSIFRQRASDKKK